MTTVDNWVEVFGQRVRELRKARGWSQQQLAYYAGLSQSAIRDVEAGGRYDDWEPHPKTLIGVAKAFGEEGAELLRSVGLKDLADHVDFEEVDPLEGLSPEIRRRVLEIARQLLELGREI